MRLNAPHNRNMELALVNFSEFLYNFFVTTHVHRKRKPPIEVAFLRLRPGKCPSKSTSKLTAARSAALSEGGLRSNSALKSGATFGVMTWIGEAAGQTTCKCSASATLALTPLEILKKALRSRIK